jgi:hypothetical protein
MTSFVSHLVQQQGLIPADETVRWSGSPAGGILFRRSDAFALPEQCCSLRRTRYVVTDRAAYVIVSGIGGDVRRYSGAVLDDVRVERDRSGAGTLRFGPDAAPAWWWSASRATSPSRR